MYFLLFSPLPQSLRSDVLAASRNCANTTADNFRVAPLNPRMPLETITPPKSGNWARLLIVFVVAFDVAAFWQWMGGAYQSEFGGHPDEGANYVAGLVVQDRMVDAVKNRGIGPDASEAAVAQKLGTNPLADDPPLFHGYRPPGLPLIQAAWITVFGTSRLSVLLLVAALAAGVATLLYGTVREEFGEWPAIATALLWLCSALVRESYGMLMPEMLGTLVMSGAALAWGRFLERGRGGDALLFALLACVAIVTEGAGFALALMAGISLVLTRHWRRLAKWELWIFSIIPVLTMIYVRRIDFENFNFSAHSLSHAAVFYAEKLAFAASLAVAVFAVIGVCSRCFSRGERQGRWMAIVSLVISIFACHCVRSHSLEARHIIASAPSLIMLAMAGVKSISVLTSAHVADARERRRRDSLWILLLLLLALPFEVMKMRRKEFDGFGAIVRTLIDEAPRDARILVSSDATGEGMFISELAMNDRRTGFTIETASMSLTEHGDRTGDPENLRERFADDQDLLGYLTGGRIHYIVLDDSPPMKERAGHHDQIRRVIENNVRNFWLLHSNPITRDGEIQFRPIQIFRVTGGN